MNSMKDDISSKNKTEKSLLITIIVYKKKGNEFILLFF